MKGEEKKTHTNPIPSSTHENKLTISNQHWVLLYMHVYCLRAIINFYNIRGNNNTNKLINQDLISL
jgi:hypothetical protein